MLISSDGHMVKWNGTAWVRTYEEENEMASSEEPKVVHPRSIDDAFGVQPGPNVEQQDQDIPFDSRQQGLIDWWTKLATGDAETTVPKAIEYGSIDLIEMGRTLARVQGREVGDEEAAEVACWFYMLGKVARWTAAISRGERVSDDTIFDIGVYSTMVRRIRTVGSWPGAL